MPAAPEISVILPFYNAEATLAAALSSVQRQTFPNFELIAVDDGSTDGSRTLVAKRAEHDPRIRLLAPWRQGVVGAMNRGVSLARGLLVARMDADDLMHTTRLERQLRYLRANLRIDLVGCQVRLFPEGMVGGGLREYIHWQNSCLTPTDVADEVYVELPIANPTLMFRHTLVDTVGGLHDGDFPEDYEFQLRLVHAGCRLAKIPEVLLDWRESAGRLTRTDPRYRREAFDRLRAEYLARDPRLASGRKLAFWGAGRRTRRRVSLLLERGFPVEAWVDIDPRKIGNRIQGAPVVGPDWLTQCGQRQRPFVLVYVANHGAREQIGAYLERTGYRRGANYLMVG